MKKNKEKEAEVPQTDAVDQENKGKEGNSAEEVSESNDEVTANSMQTQLQEANDKYLRLYSEFDNFRRRTARERIELISSANAELLQNLLPVLDDFDRAMKFMHESSDIEAVKQGLQLVHHKLQHTLEQKGLKAFDSREQAFDPDYHEAVTKIPAGNDALKGKVVDELEKGYMLGEKVLRYAKVVVGE
jgi:molecular chaperone GrpE